MQLFKSGYSFEEHVQLPTFAALNTHQFVINKNRLSL